MSDAVSFAELDDQHVELLSARTVLSVFSAIPIGDAESTTSSGTTSSAGQSPSLLSMMGLTGMSPGADGTNADGSSGAENS